MNIYLVRRFSFGYRAPRRADIDHGEWRGPAVVIVKESRWRSRRLLLSAASTGGATIKENATAGLEELRESKKGGEKEAMNMRTFRKDQRKSEEKKKEDEGWEAQEGLLRFGKEERQDTKRSGATNDRSQKYQEIGSDQVSEGEKGARKAEKGAQED